MWKTRYGPNATASVASARRSRAPASRDRARRSTARRPPPAQSPTARGTCTRERPRQLPNRGRRPQHHHAGEVFRALVEQGLQVGGGAAGQHDERDGPDEAAGDVARRHTGSCPPPFTPAAVAQPPSRSTGSVSHTTCDRMPAPSPATRPRRSSAVRARAVTATAWTASATARPGTSLNGRAAVTQNSGDVTIRSAARMTTWLRGGWTIRSSDFEQCHESEHGQPARQRCRSG